MGARLISPDGQIFELSVADYVQMQTVLISQLPTREERIAALIELINATKEDTDAAIWAEFDRMMQEH